jgi:hypothetical protein
MCGEINTCEVCISYACDNNDESLKREESLEKLNDRKFNRDLYV